MWLGFIVYSIGNCTIKLCIKTGLTKHLEREKRGGGGGGGGGRERGRCR
jgi:hypothetical protein